MASVTNENLTVRVSVDAIPSKYELRLVVEDPNLREAYEEALEARNPNDLGLDLPLPADLEIDLTKDAAAVYVPRKIDLGVRAAMYELHTDGTEVRVGYMLVPRSSIYRTPIRLVNSIGIIDHYNGVLMAPIETRYSVRLPKYKRLFQIVGFTGRPFSVRFVDKLNSSVRGEGGFGSTG